MKGIFLSLLLCLSTCGLAQSSYHLQSNPANWYKLESDELNNTLKKDLEIRNLQLDRISKEKNIPLSYRGKDNVYYELIDYYPDGTPIYYQTFNARASIASNVNALQNDYGFNLSGKGVILGLFDTSVLYHKHVEFLNYSNVFIKSPVPSPNSSFSVLSNYTILQEHSTHTGGTIKAFGVDKNAKGLANSVELWSYDWKSDILDILNASKAGMLISNHSYGQTIVNDSGQLMLDEKLVGTYDAKASQFDYVTSIAPYYQPVVAAGNFQEFSAVIHPNSSGYSNIASFSTAKNAVVVGAAKDFIGNNNIHDLRIASFSSYGPTRDFRIKPDITAKGVDLFSPVCDYLISPNYQLSNKKYDFSSGTSMAAPVVSAVLALWQQWAIENLGQPLLSASLRALIAHSALPATKMLLPNTVSYIDVAPVPNAAYGWGVIDAKKGVSIMTNTKLNLSYIIESKLTNNERKVYVIDNVFDDNEVDVTFAWTDPQGPYDYSNVIHGIYQGALVNDLDLRITVDQEVYYPWALNKDMSNPIAKKMDNNVDNIEKVATVKLVKGKTNIVLSHKGNLLNPSQDYSLIVTTKKKVGLSLITNLIDSEVTPKVEELKNVELDRAKNIQIAPNPVQDELTFYFDVGKDSQILAVQIFSTNGELKMNFTAVYDNKVLVSNLSRGKYLAKIYTKEGISFSSFIKK